MTQQGIRAPQERYLDTSETMVWGLDVSNVGLKTAEVSNPDMKVTDLASGTDVTASVADGVMRIEGQMVILKRIHNLKAKRKYLVEVFYTKQDNRLESHFEIICVD